MLIPAVAFIEIALASVGHTDHAADVRNELQEFRALGQGRLSKLVIPHAATDLERGYLIGLETARVLLRGMPAAVAAGIEL